MRIALDARTIYGAHRRGIGKTLVDLYAHLAQVRPHWSVTAFHRSSSSGDDALSLPMLSPRSVEMIGDRFDAWQRWRLPLAAKFDGATLLHCPANHCPSWVPVPTIVTIHDLIPLDMPYGRPVAEVRRFEQSVQQACRRAAWLTTPSEYTRQRLIHDFGADPQRTTVIPWAADSMLGSDVSAMDPLEAERVMAKLNIDAPYVLHFGAGEIRKNTHRVIEAWSMVKPAMRRGWKLVIVGLDARAFEDMARCVTRLNLNRSVSLHGFVDQADIAPLMHKATVLAYPSLLEGFGLPVLDAFATDTTVLTAASGAIAEVGGDAVHYTDPTDACAIAKSLGRLMTEPSYRMHLIARGRERLAAFSWHQTAERFAETLERVAALARRRAAA